MADRPRRALRALLSSLRLRRRPRRPRTTPILQMEAVECGAAALGIVLAHHRRHVSLEALRMECGVSRDGSKASHIAQAARRYGLNAKGLRVEPEALPGLPAPAILYWEFRHFVVYEGTGRKLGRPVVFLNDPATGRRTVTPAEFDSAFTGVVLTFEPGPDFRPGGRKPRPLSGLGLRLRGTSGPLLLAVASSLLLLVAGIAMPAFTRTYVDSVLLGGQVELLPALLGSMALVTCVVAGLTALQQTSLTWVQLVTSTLTQARFLRHLLRLPVGFFSQRSPAELTRRLSSNHTIAQILARDVVTTAVNAEVVLVYAALMWMYDPTLTLVGVGMALLNIAALHVATRVRESGVVKLRADRAKLYAASFDGLQQIETLKSTGGESAHFARWAGRHAALLGTQQSVGVPTALLAVVPGLLAAVNSALILLVGGIRSVDGHISVGLLVAFQALVAGFSRPVAELSGVAGRVQDFAADMTRLRDVEDFRQDPVFDRPEPDTVQPLVGRLELNAVTFGYSPLAAPLLHELTLTVRPGRQVALVGGSGSGKSTVAKLISGLYEPWSGEIRIDGQPRGDLPRTTLATSVAFVDQDIFLFEGTVRDNVTMWDPSISDEAVVDALRDAALLDVVAARGGGILARVEERGRNFSGGQRQRLEIARALVRNPGILVLDEATSALDVETEREIAENVLRRGCASLIIAHRLSTVRDSAEIIVLDRGRAVERGTHDELTAAGGTYADLVRTR
ncbi:NHLP family bacteriocin export ABC transporter peptidase/permease/ATPase subunit [Streptomyces sp. NPDC048290]|uniref:NHLP family bacteriocin export ABC transporter peptidase/permease/ATPase subunit n=1 Tax=Streptomyces sp. NPDC048290 TaxID=3155811 RepID=UPI00341A152A